jgi:hypothetical protein
MNPWSIAVEQRKERTAMWGFSKHLLLAALGLTLSTASAYADLGWTLAQSKQAYGEPTTGPEETGDISYYEFKAQGYTITAGYLNGRVGEVVYQRQAVALDMPLIDFFKAENCPNTQWHIVREEALVYWSGQKEGEKEEAYRAALSDDPTTLTIVTSDFVGRKMLRQFMGWISQ